MEPGGSELIVQSQRDWAEAPETLALSRDHVDVWKICLNQPESVLRLLEQTLASEERARVRRFRFKRDRRRFIAARGQLRMILGCYVSVDPRALVFRYGPRGKPLLTKASDAQELKFNLSHSGELALAAVTQDREIGVDLEEIRALDDAERIAKRFFSPREYAVLRELPETDKLEAFFHCWTYKEAYIKATGDGLARPTESFDVTFVRGEPARLLSVGGQADEPSRWSLVGLVPAHGYVGALAVEGDGWGLACWRWTQHE